jgi:probable rRNA maturation factor
VNGEAQPLLVDVLIEDERWQEAGIEAIANDAARAALIASGLAPEKYEISLLACSDTRIASLNDAFRGKPTATNVLSWPAQAALSPEATTGEIVLLGDIALAFETCAREAAGITLRDHATHLVVHATLHLLGHDHDADTAATAMEALETKILAILGIADPYAA